ncbi:hypothetical protein QF040_001995 [Variovorax sp. W2I14]
MEPTMPISKHTEPDADHRSVDVMEKFGAVA